MNLSKSKYCNAIQCKKMLWLSENKPEVKEETSNDSVLDNGTEVGMLAKDLLGEHIDIAYSNNLIEMINDTNKALENDNVVITEASFDYNQNFCSVDILKKENDKYYIYEVKSSTEVHDIYIDDISYQTYVLKSLGFNVEKMFIVHINSNYERHGDLDIHKLFVIEDVKEKVLNKLSTLENNIDIIKKYMNNKEEVNEDIGMHCVNPYPCPFFKYCTRSLPDNNVFNLRSMRNKDKFDLYHKGKFTYQDLLKENIDEKFKEQINFELYDLKDKIIAKDIKDFLNSLTYPLYFLDFETFQEAIPSYDGVKPYMQIPFQYSLHYIENNNLFHKEFLADGISDPRRKLAESLVKDIPLDVTTLAYNMSFEKSVIKNLAGLFPDLSDHLMNIYNNIKDLMIPFKNRKYYSKNMFGSYSIKYVLPALFPDDPSLNYHNLNLVHNGKEAMNTYKDLKNHEGIELDVIRHNLLEYCKLDTYAMVKIYEKLMEVTNE